MSFQTGTIAKLNDVLNVLAAFLTANGWTINGNWNEPMYVRTLGAPPKLWWRYGRRLTASKGAVAIAAQDFFYTYDIAYGTINGVGPGVVQGPGLAITCGTSFSVGDSGNDAAHPLSGYSLTGPAAFPTFQGLPGKPESTSGIVRTFIMPLPDCVSHPMGTWTSADHIMYDTDPVSNATGDPSLPAVFGAIGGAAKAMRYWLMCDAAGDNVVFVVDRSGVDSPYIAATPYCFFGDMTASKAGAWTGGAYCGASLGNNDPYRIIAGEFNHVNRFAGPGALRDNGMVTCVLRADVDTFVGKYLGLAQNSANVNIGTGRDFTSSTILVGGRPGDPLPVDPAGMVNMGAQYVTLRNRAATLTNGGPCLPTYWMVQRDTTLWSIMGVLPNVYQCKMAGVDWGVDDGSEIVYFDSFAVRKIP